MEGDIEKRGRMRDGDSKKSFKSRGIRKLSISLHHGSAPNTCLVDGFLAIAGGLHFNIEEWMRETLKDLGAFSIAYNKWTKFERRYTERGR